MATLFSRIAAGEIPCCTVAEDEKHFAFLDINPVAMGHTLVIPKKEIDYIFDLDDQELADLNVFAKKVAKAIQKAFPCRKVGITVIGLEVPHAHIHLVPMNQESDIYFNKEHLHPSQEELQAAADAIAKHIQL